MVMDVLRRLERNEHKRWQMPPHPVFPAVPLVKAGVVRWLPTMTGAELIDGGG